MSFEIAYFIMCILGFTAGYIGYKRRWPWYIVVPVLMLVALLLAMVVKS